MLSDIILISFDLFIGITSRDREKASEICPGRKKPLNEGDAGLAANGFQTFDPPPHRCPCPTANHAASRSCFGNRSISALTLRQRAASAAS